jgi:hypothetical protein
MLEPVLLARNHKFEIPLNCCDIHSISKNQYQVILARYLQAQAKKLDVFFLEFAQRPSLPCTDKPTLSLSINGNICNFSFTYDNLILVQNITSSINPIF